MSLRTHFGARLRELREAKGLTQSELGPQNYVSAVEIGRKNLTFRRAEEFAARLNCDPLELFRPLSGEGKQ